MFGLLLAAASEEWDGDEFLLLIFCGFVSLFGLGHAWHAIRAVPALTGDRWRRAALVAIIAAALAMILFVTWHWSSRESRDGSDYTWLVMTMGTAWLTLCSGLFSWMGVSFRDDACERLNAAALVAGCGALLGAALLYCGAIVGEGPSFWNNVVTVLLGGSAWFGFWLGLELATHISRSVTEDRDLASGWRLGGFLLAQSFILGRAMAGNWHSTRVTALDLCREGWPAVLVLLVAVAAEWIFRPTPRNPKPRIVTSGLTIVLLEISVAAAWLARLGWWEGAPR